MLMQILWRRKASPPTPDPSGVPASVVGPVMLALSYALLLAFLYANRWIPGAIVMTIGLVLNLTVVVLNGGMPVQAAAIERSGGDPAVVTAGSSRPVNRLVVGSAA